MRVKKISAFVLAMVLCLSPFTLFSFAADTQSLKDSGSPDFSLMALRSIAADDGISLAAAEGNSGQFGYNIKSVDVPVEYTFLESSSGSYNYKITRLTFPVYDLGTYSLTVRLENSISNAYFSFVSELPSQSSWTPNSSEVTYTFEVTKPDSVRLTLYSLVSSFSDYSQNNVTSFVLYNLFPVEGISSGYTYSSGILDRSTRSIFSSFDADFGSQPAGKYLVNIYHWGDSYDVRFQISDSSESYYLPTSTNGSVTTLVYNHPGGQFTLDGSFTASNDETSSVYGDLYAHVDGSFTGSLSADSPLSWVFNIKDIVAIPYDQAADHNFGFFAPIIGFFNDHFSNMKSFIAEQIDKIAGDDETKSVVDDAQSELQKEVEDLNNLSGQLDTQAFNLEQQFTTDFAIPDTVSGQGTNFHSIYTSLFGSLGVFGIFIWLPIVMAVIKKLLRL